jgi:23S rRNA (cytosine1962-C5)-methyltransferase
MSVMPTVRINRKAVSRIESGHPWVFASDVIDRGEARRGDAVVVVDPRGKSLGTAHYSSASQITLRLLSRRVETVDRAFLKFRIEAARRHRSRVVSDTEAYRLVHAEGDLLPGLIIDRYGDYFSVQLLDQGMDRLETDVAEVLTELFRAKGIVARNDASIRAKEELAIEVKVLSGDLPERVAVRMNGLTWQADLLHFSRSARKLSRRKTLCAWPRARLLYGHRGFCTTSRGTLRLCGSCGQLGPNTRTGENKR